MDVAPEVLTHDPWLSALMQRDAFTLNLEKVSVEVGAGFGKTSTAELLSARLKEVISKPVFITSKVPTSNLFDCRFVEDRGFHLIDTNVLFSKQCAVDEKATNAGTITFRKATPADREDVVEIAGRSFQFSRFHLDPDIPERIANEIKAAWAANYFHGKRGDDMVVATLRGQVIGFAQLLFRKSGAIIDLIAVAPEFQRQGAAAGMIRLAESLAAEQSLETISVGTQIANAPSIGFYEYLGFRIVNSSYVFHFHND